MSDQVGLEECGCSLHCGVEYHANVCAVLKPEDCADCGEGHVLGDLECQSVKGSMFFVSMMIRVFFGSNPSAIRSSAFSYAHSCGVSRMRSRSGRGISRRRSSESRAWHRTCLADIW